VRSGSLAHVEVCDVFEKNLESEEERDEGGIIFDWNGEMVEEEIESNGNSKQTYD